WQGVHGWLVDLDPLVPRRADQAFALQDHERVPDRTPADLEPLGQFFFAQVLAALQFAVQDGLAEPVGDVVPEGFAAGRRERGHCLTAPNVRPLTKPRWTAIVAISAGTTTMSPAAASSLQFEVSVPTKEYTATGAVWVRGPVRMAAPKYSPQEARPTSRPTVLTPGQTGGRTPRHSARILLHPSI